ncbi:hypothetical protein GN325_20485 [Agrobacterium vitis]|uniref:hypothetical protein n=1 Tax=Agrobacterium vitis TaxID=373 RepID=UPI00115FE47F|nr:hypothetical protein [Agrobacterium vitis]MUO83976.1 hypothetical protein [Agrobacterium vitis]MVB04144.1 hypothetical protein [Agrobacterium vitis]
MVDDMATNGETNRNYQDAMTAQLGERVTNLGRRQSDLESEMRSGFKQMESAVSALANEMRNSVSSLSTNISERNKPQWQALGVALTFCTLIGGLAYWPIQSSTTDLKAAVLSISERMVTQKEMEWRAKRSEEDRQRSEGSIKDIRDNLVPRAEHERVWKNGEDRVADLQRQVDELKQAQGNVYGARDFLLDLRERLDRVERQRPSPAS